MKTCKKCNISKDLNAFYYNPKTRGKKESHCKKCRSIAVASSRKNPLHHNKWCDYKWRSSLRYRYGLEPEQYETMLKNQKYKCAICLSKTPNGHGKRFNVDHDHSTGQIRGLLCVSCNTGLGRFKHDIKSLKRAIKYLKRCKFNQNLYVL